MSATTDPRAAAEEALRIRGDQPFWSLRSGDLTDLAKLAPILARAVIEQADAIEAAEERAANMAARAQGADGEAAAMREERDAARDALEALRAKARAVCDASSEIPDDGDLLPIADYLVPDEEYQALRAELEKPGATTTEGE